MSKFCYDKSIIYKYQTIMCLDQYNGILRDLDQQLL